MNASNTLISFLLIALLLALAHPQEAQNPTGAAVNVLTSSPSPFLQSQSTPSRLKHPNPINLDLCLPKAIRLQLRLRVRFTLPVKGAARRSQMLRFLRMYMQLTSRQKQLVPLLTHRGNSMHIQSLGRRLLEENQPKSGRCLDEISIFVLR